MTIRTAADVRRAADAIGRILARKSDDDEMLF